MTVASIDRLDLEPIVFKLTHSENRQALTLAEADEAVDLYRMFLKLRLLHPDVTLVPSKSIDQVWHAHMADTAKYRWDCQAIFGGPVDHWPYAGTMSDQDTRQLADNYQRTCELFRETFGTEPTGTAGPCSVNVA